MKLVLLASIFAIQLAATQTYAQHSAPSCTQKFSTTTVVNADNPNKLTSLTCDVTCGVTGPSSKTMTCQFTLPPGAQRQEVCSWGPNSLSANQVAVRSFSCASRG